MYSGSAPLILYSLPKIVTLSVSGSVAIAIPSDRYVLATVLGREAGRTARKLGVYRPFEHGQFHQHLFHAPRHRATLIEQRGLLLLERLKPRFPIRPNFPGHERGP